MTRHELCEFVELHGKELYSFCCHLTQNKHTADDLYQETFLQAAERLDKIDPSMNPKSFLISLAVGIWKNQIRKQSGRQAIAPMATLNEEDSMDIPDPKSPGPEEILLAKEVCCLVRTLIASLDEKYRLPIYMYYVAELPVDQISSALHIPNGTVKSRLHKARKLLKKRLEEHGYEG